MRIEKWNYDRNNTNFKPELENRMLAEEAQEFKDGMNMFFEATDVEESGAALIEMVDAWADYQFVLQGTLYKYLGANNTSFNLSNIKIQEKYMYSMLTEFCEIPKDTLNQCLLAVIKANEAKGTKKVEGKIQKGTSWVDPKDTIRGLLNEL